MIPLQTQRQFEDLIRLDDEAYGNRIVYFTASWCKACKKLDLDKLMALRKDVTWYKCDVDENNYTLGYCGFQKIPSFLFLKDGMIVGSISSSNTEAIEILIQKHF